MPPRLLVGWASSARRDAGVSEYMSASSVLSAARATLVRVRGRDRDRDRDRGGAEVDFVEDVLQVVVWQGRGEGW